MKLDDLLNARRIPFERLHHRPTYTASRLAEELHVPGREVAKTVLLRTGQGYVVTVLPADHKLDLDRVRACLAEDEVAMASEAEMERLFPDCERGTLPPFGSLYHLRTLMDESLADDEEIVFDAPNHEEAIRMTFRDYEELEHPMKGRFARHA
jgi:Ala-tRNA(Pro) deacylase